MPRGCQIKKQVEKLHAKSQDRIHLERIINGESTFSASVSETNSDPLPGPWSGDLNEYDNSFRRPVGPALP
jgi:hypothetical protein